MQNLLNGKELGRRSNKKKVTVMAAEGTMEKKQQQIKPHRSGVGGRRGRGRARRRSGGKGLVGHIKEFCMF